MTLAHKIALDPTPDQRQAFAKACGCARVAYNWGLATAIDRWDKTGKLPSGFKLKKEFNAIKGELYPWIYESPKGANQQPFSNLQTAFTRAFSNKKAGRGWHPPKFKKKGQRDSFYSESDNVSFRPGAIRLPVIGWIKVFENLRFNGKVISATVSCQAHRWFVSVSVEMLDYQKQRTGDGEVGIDLGLKATIVTSDGQTFQAPKALKRYLKRLKRLSKAHFHKVKGSKNRKKSQESLARVHKRIADIRNDFTHKTTTQLCRENKTVAIEDLNVQGMLKNRRLSRALSDVSFGEIRRQLTYKVKIYGNDLRIIDRWFPSSKKCSRCGNVKTKLSLSERVYNCGVCGVSLDRDLNAALNIKAVGLTVSACGPPHCKLEFLVSNRDGMKQELKTCESPPGLTF